MLTSVAYTPGRAPATQQQFVSVCLPHTIFTLYRKISAAAGMGPSFSRRGCVSRSALERVCFLAISTSAKGLWARYLDENPKRAQCVSAPARRGSHPTGRGLDTTRVWYLDIQGGAS